jgi:Rrf2 family transcriptional regulator, iron-sulfur cluster assembly transcription factor
MLTLSQKMFYAVEAVIYIAYNAKGEPISGREVAERQDLPPRYLEQMMQKLVHAGILRGMRGPNGGYILGRERRNITLKDICAALDEKEKVTTHTSLGKALLAPLTHELHTAWLDQLEDITIQQLCEKATTQRIKLDHKPVSDFTI